VVARTAWALFSAALFVIGLASLALTLYLWFGDWPREVREIVDHQRSMAANAGRAPEPLIGNVHARAPLVLNGSWQAAIDPHGVGELLGIAARAAEPRSPSDHAEFSFENGLRLEVPGDWNTQDPRLVFYRGIVWYKRSFDHVPKPGRRSFLRFGAANYRASVYLNGRLVGEHEGGFTPFNYEVSESLREGENLLVVAVDNRKGPDDVPTPRTDWLNYGGLTRDVLLVDVPEVFIRSWELRLAEGEPSRIEGRVALDGATTPTRVRVSIPELERTIELESDASGVAEFQLDAEPRRWSPEDPTLYRVEIETDRDAIHDEIGFRTVSVRGDEILLNGSPLFLRGVSIHEEALGGGRAHGPDDAAGLLDLARELGANFVRLAHYPHDEHTVRLADRMGLLVWAEIPVYWNIDFANEVTQERAERQLSELIERDRNRASVVLWSIGNETPETEDRLRFMTALAAHVRTDDPSRLVAGALLTGESSLADFVLYAYLPALLGWERDEWVLRVRDPLAEVVDVPAINEYFGWYYSGAIGLLGPFSSHHARRVMLDNMDRIRIELPVRKPLVVSEFGAGAVAGRRAPEGALAVFSEDYQALVYRRQLAMLSRQPGLAGISPWVLKDFRAPLRLYQGTQDYWNRKGLVSHEGREKLAFGVLRDHYAELGAASVGSGR